MSLITFDWAQIAYVQSPYVFLRILREIVV